MEAPKNSNAALYAMYLTMYANDTACNCIYDIKPYVANKDKETIKIYGALKKRADSYFELVRKVIKIKGLYFIADFNGIIDEYVDSATEMLVKTIRGCLRKHNIEDDGLLYTTIVAHVLTDFAINNTRGFSSSLKRTDPKMRGLDNWTITEIQRVMTNFYLWVCRKIPNNVLKEMNNLVAPVTILYANGITNIPNFERAYKTALAREKEKENDRNERRNS